jgi:EAL domain-containing protein (putative c-di-GMP-specific phosphodiesterase class I)
LKIDKTFIDKITNRKDMKQIVGNIIALAHHLGMEVVAEGVVQEEQLEYLKKENCDYIQGYLLSRPIEEDQIIKHYDLQQRA